MRFSDLTPADKLKAAGLSGLIVIVLVLVVHTMLGAISPKAAPAPDATAAVPSLPVSPDAPMLTPPGAPGAGQGTGLLGSSGITGLGVPAVAVHDPFVPLRSTATDNAPAPQVSFSMGLGKDRRPGITLPSFDKLFGMEDPARPRPDEVRPEPTPAEPQPAPEPDIRVLGYVEGESTLVTIETGGKVMNCRPGDVIAPGYRLVAADTAGAHVRAKGRLTIIRIGASLNAPTGPAAAASAPAPSAP